MKNQILVQNSENNTRIQNKRLKSTHSICFTRILKFFLVGLIMGIIEDIIAVSMSTGETITWSVLWIVSLVAIPFAIISELVVYHLKPFRKKNKLQIFGENQ